MSVTRSDQTRSSAEIVRTIRRQAANHVKLRTRFVPDFGRLPIIVPYEDKPSDVNDQRSCDMQEQRLFIDFNDVHCCSRQSAGACKKRRAHPSAAYADAHCAINRTKSTESKNSLIYLIQRGAPLLLFILCSSNLTQALNHNHNGHILPHQITPFHQRSLEKGPDWARANFDSDLEIQQQPVEYSAPREDHSSRLDLLTAAASPFSTQDFHQAPSEWDNLFANLHGSDGPAYLLIVPSFPQAEGRISMNASQQHFRQIQHHNYRPSTSLPSDETRKQQQQQQQQQHQRQQEKHQVHLTETNNDVAGHSSRRDDQFADGMSSSGDDLLAVASAPELRFAPGQSGVERAHQASLAHTNGQQRGGRSPPGRQTTAPVSSNVITAHRMAELSFRQAPLVSAGLSRLTSVQNNNNNDADTAASEQSRVRATATAAASANSQAAAVSGEGQWIPIVTISGHNNANRRSNRVSSLVEGGANHGVHNPVAQSTSGNQASNALLDSRRESESVLSSSSSPRPPLAPPVKPSTSPFPPPSPPSPLTLSAAQNGQPLKARRAREQLILTSESKLAARPASASTNQRRPLEPQHTASSHVHDYGHPYPHAPNNYANDHFHHAHQDQSRHHRQRNPHWHQIDTPPPTYHYRRPRLNSHHNHQQHHQHNHQYENSIEHDAIEFRPNKIYKRVLLCDKTLVSLDYIYSLEAEPRPDNGAGVNQFLNEHEINEITDNFIPNELDGNYEMIARSGSSSIESGPKVSFLSQNSSDTQRVSGTQMMNGTSNEIATEASENKAASMVLDRRHLLSDDDPLVRCDMWDLEKGLKSRKPPDGILRQAIKADFDTVRDAINRCRQLSERTLPADDEYRDGLDIMSSEDLVSLFSVKRGLIPGTKWCGLGDQANSYNDLGPKHRIDICCRAHDHCPIRSKPFRNDYGILNIGLYTKSHCDCDADFYRCLREVRSRTADMLGNLYFNVMKLQCMREERLKICREMKPIALGFERCIRYEESPHKRVFKFTTPPVAY